MLFLTTNGVGKATTIDAIEWCLTGDIGRLKMLLIPGVRMGLISKAEHRWYFEAPRCWNKEKIKVVL